MVFSQEKGGGQATSIFLIKLPSR